MRRSTFLASTPLFQEYSGHLPRQERIYQSYERALAVGKLYNLSADDILHTSGKYWELHTDPIMAMDGAMATLLTIHYNLCCGSFAQFAMRRPDLANILQSLLTFEYFGNFCLTEVGHGLDAINLETTATVQPDGSFELNTPNDRAAKCMPPTAPAGIPSIAVVFARLIMCEEDHGVKPFFVVLHDGKTMSPGIVCKPLSPRGAAKPVDHALTYFHHVNLPPNALMTSMERATDIRSDFFRNLSRVITGSMSMGALSNVGMQVACYVAARYSQRRTVFDAFTGAPRPIISFSTQYIPILTALAQTNVMEAFLKKCIVIFTNPQSGFRLRHCIAAIFKVVSVRHSQSACLELGDRCGAQGLFEINQLSVMHADMRGAAIAEGDVLVLSIKFAVELLIGRINLPPSADPGSLLARHEHSLFQDLRQQLSAMAHHRDSAFEATLLPQCLPFIQAIGHRMAYDAAVEAGIDKHIVDLYVASVLKYDSGWYSEFAQMPVSEQKALERRAVATVLPRLDTLLEDLDIESYCTAPITSDKKWDRYIQSLPAFRSAYSGLNTSEDLSDSNVPLRAHL